MQMAADDRRPQENGTICLAGGGAGRPAPTLRVSFLPQVVAALSEAPKSRKTSGPRRSARVLTAMRISREIHSAGPPCNPDTSDNMSNATQHSRSAGEGRRRRSRGGKNRNRQQQDGRSDGDKNARQGQGQGQGQGPRPSRGRAKPSVKLTWWQKLLKAIGLYKEPARPARPAQEIPQAPKSNVRNVRSSGDAKAAGKPAATKRPSRGGDPSTVESARLYVGNLSYDVTEQDLQELFKGVGGVRNVEIIYNRSTHRSKGYGFVEMLHKDEALRAVEVLHDQPFMGRKLNVSGAKSKGQDEREERDDGGDGDRIVSLAPLPAGNPQAQAADEPAVEESSAADTARRSEVA